MKRAKAIFLILSLLVGLTPSFCHAAGTEITERADADGTYYMSTVSTDAQGNKKTIEHHYDAHGMLIETTEMSVDPEGTDRVEVKKDGDGNLIQTAVTRSGTENGKTSAHTIITDETNTMVGTKESVSTLTAADDGSAVVTETAVTKDKSGAKIAEKRTVTTTSADEKRKTIEETIKSASGKTVSVTETSIGKEADGSTTTIITKKNVKGSVTGTSEFHILTKNNTTHIDIEIKDKEGVTTDSKEITVEKSGSMSEITTVWKDRWGRTPNTTTEHITMVTEDQRTVTRTETEIDDGGVLIKKSRIETRQTTADGTFGVTRTDTEERTEHSYGGTTKLIESVTETKQRDQTTGAVTTIRESVQKRSYKEGGELGNHRSETTTETTDTKTVASDGVTVLGKTRSARSAGEVYDEDGDYEATSVVNTKESTDADGITRVTEESTTKDLDGETTGYRDEHVTDADGNRLSASYRESFADSHGTGSESTSYMDGTGSLKKIVVSTRKKGALIQKLTYQPKGTNKAVLVKVNKTDGSLRIPAGIWVSNGQMGMLRKVTAVAANALGSKKIRRITVNANITTTYASKVFKGFKGKIVVQAKNKTVYRKAVKKLKAAGAKKAKFQFKLVTNNYK